LFQSARPITGKEGNKPTTDAYWEKEEEKVRFVL
jgi:hypothetical protein